MSSIGQESASANKIGYLRIMLALNERQHERQFGRRTSYAFAWMLLGFMIGGWLVSQWVG
jgi:hypothetical protein